MKKKFITNLSIILSILTLITGCSSVNSEINSEKTNENTINIEEKIEENHISGNGNEENLEISEITIPAYSGSPYVEINNNVPRFSNSELTIEKFEKYSELDSLGRCGVAYANICKEIMPIEERGAIGMVKPSGWHTVKYDCVDGKYLYNRCHLIGFQLAGENANEKNLITGTRYLNVDGMLPFENMVADYVKETNHHVLYRITPYYEGDNLVASGVFMEAQSVEDNNLSFFVYCYNIQPGIAINYQTGESSLIREENNEKIVEQDTNITYILNTNTRKIHKPNCSSVEDIKEENREEVSTDINKLLNDGYERCKRCNP